MKLFAIVGTAAVVGIALGFAANVGEFGIYPADPDFSAVTPLNLPDGPQPKLVIEKSTFDFGTMFQDEKGEHTFLLKNVGQAPLQLKPGDPSCKCTGSKLSRKVIPPGESATAALQWSTGHTRRVFQASLPITTNDPKQKNARLVITGTVLPDVKVEPKEIRVPNYSRYDPSEHTAIVYFYRDAEAQIVSQTFSNQETKEFFEVRYEPIPADQMEDEHALSAYRINLLIKPGMKIGVFSQFLLFNTTAKSQRAVRLKVYGDIRPDISFFSPNWTDETNTLYVGKVKRGSSRVTKLAAHLTGQHRETMELKIKRVEPTDLRVSIGEKTPAAGGRIIRALLEVEVPEDAQPVDLNGETAEEQGLIVLETSHPHYPEILIHVRMTVFE